MGIQRSWLTSWAIRPIGKSGARSSGPAGCFVPGWSGGSIGTGISARMLYQALGISFSLKRIFVSAMRSLLIFSEKLLDFGGDIRALHQRGAYKDTIRALLFQPLDILA